MSGLATSKCKIIGLHDASVTVGHPQKARFQHLCTPVKGDLLTMGGMARDGTSDAFVLVMKGGHRPVHSRPGSWHLGTHHI